MAPEPADVTIASASRDALCRAWSGSLEPPARHVASLGDGTTLEVERGIAGDLRFQHLDTERGGRDVALFHLSADRRRLRCATEDAGDPDWRRVLLDSVLGTASLAHGLEALHAGAVVLGGRAVAVAAGTGGGKSTLLAELLRRGAELISDDVLVVERAGGDARVLAHPGPALMNLPAEPAGGPLPAGLARPLARLAGEDWVEVARGALEPLPLAAIAILAREPGTALAVERRAALPAELLPHMLPAQRGSRRRARLAELLVALAGSVPVLHLSAPPEAPPGALADALTGAVAALDVATVPPPSAATAAA